MLNPTDRPFPNAYPSSPSPSPSGISPKFTENPFPGVPAAVMLTRKLAVKPLSSWPGSRSRIFKEEAALLTPSTVIRSMLVRTEAMGASGSPTNGLERTTPSFQPLLPGTVPLAKVNCWGPYFPAKTELGSQRRTTASAGKTVARTRREAKQRVNCIKTTLLHSILRPAIRYPGHASATIRD